MARAEQRAAAALLDAGEGASTALVEGDVTVTYDQLRQRIGARRAELALPTRSLVVLVAEPSVEFVTTYLALLDGGHVPLLAADHADRLAKAWGADALVEVTGGELASSGRPRLPTVSCILTSPSCSAPRARPARRSSSASRTPT